ncbi:MAG TPA: hypothetical protein PK335_07495 [Draconibacterium sp.]|nr:hypothetical protein [Draconibacterium sp.]
MKRVLTLLILLTMLACSPQRTLSRHYVGKNISEIQAELGEPKSILDHADEKVYVFEKIEELRGTEIHQAKLTLDPIVTPKVTKTERFYVTVKNDVVTKIKLENEYER